MGAWKYFKCGIGRPDSEDSGIRVQQEDESRTNPISEIQTNRVMNKRAVPFKMKNVGIVSIPLIRSFTISIKSFAPRCARANG